MSIMASASLLQLRSSWAQSLASINPVDEEKVALLLRLCARQSPSGLPCFRDAVASILPLVGFVDRSGGQRVDLIMPEIMRQLPLLATQWAQPCALDLGALERLLEDLFTALRSVLHNADVPARWRHALSGVAAELLTQMLKTVLHMPSDKPSPPALAPPPSQPLPPPATAAAAPPAPDGNGAPPAPQKQQQRPVPLPATAPAQILLRTLTRSHVFAAGAGLPLLPTEAEAMLSWMVENVLPPGGKPMAPTALAPAPGTRAAVGAAAAGDEKVLLLMAQLTRTMLTSQCGGGSGGIVTAAAGAGGSREDVKRGGLEERERLLLTTILSWSMSLLRAVMTKLLQPVTGMEALSSALLAGRQPAAAAQPQTVGAIRALARLAATAMHGLLLRSSRAAAAAGVASPAATAAAGGVLTAAARTQLMDVISLMLDMAESCVSLPLDAGAQLTGADKMLDIAAYILEDCSSLVVIAARETATLSTTAPSPVPATNGAAATTPPQPAVAASASSSAAAAWDAGTIFSRLKAILLAAAALVGQETPGPAGADGGSWRRYWLWDVSRPLTASYMRVGGRTPGWGAQRLCSNVAEALVCGLAACYHAGLPIYVRALLLLPVSLPGGAAAVSGGSGVGADVPNANEALVLSLAMGRLFVLLRGEEALARSMVPLLTDVLVQPAASTAAVSLKASVVQTLAAMAACSVKAERAVTWTYVQIADVLLRLLLESQNPGSSMAPLAARAAGPGVDALSAGLLKLAKDMRGAPSAARRDYRHRLLVQFGELGLRAGCSNPNHEMVRGEMGRLLAAIAEACEGLEGPSVNLSMSLSSLAAQQQQQPLNGGGGGGRTDLQMIRLLRNLWLYVALFGLSSSRKGVPQEQLDAVGRIAACTPVLLLGETAAASEMDVAEQLKVELGERLRLAGDAVAAPARLRSSLQSLLGVPLGGSPQPPPDANLQAYLLTVATAELCRAQHAQLRAEAEAEAEGRSPIAVALTYLQLADPVSSEAAWYSAIAKKAFKVYMDRLREAAARPAATRPVAAANGIDGSGVDDDHHRRASNFPSGWDPSCAGLSVAPLNGSYANSVRFSVPAGDLAWPGEAADLNGDEDGFAAAAAAATGPARVSERCLEVLAVSLIRHLGAAGGHEEGVAPQVATVSGLLLRDLLDTYAPVYWSYTCMEALLSELESEESLDHPLSEVHGANNLSGQAAQSNTTNLMVVPGTGGLVWRWLKSWVSEAARIAPARTEALLHQFLGKPSIGSRSFPLFEGGAEGKGLALDGLSTPTGLSPMPLPSSSAAAARSPASLHARARALAAARRRNNDLMVVVAEARRASPVGAGTGTGAAAAGTEALCSKQFYSGFIEGMQYTAGGQSPGPVAVAERALAGLEEGLAAACHNFPLLRMRYLAAAAFLARQAAEDEEGEGDSLTGNAAHALGYRLLLQLCMAPLRRFAPDMMHLATFAWTWVSTAGPSCLVPLVSRTAAAWSATVDRGMGLFNGAWGKSAASGHEPAEEDGGRAAAATEWELLKALACHHQWIAFLHETWASAGNRTDTERRALTSVYDRLLHHSLAAPEARLCAHPAAVAPLFRLLQLALSYIDSAAAFAPGGRPWRPAQALLYDRVVRAGLLWFSHPVTYTARISQGEAEEQHRAVAEFMGFLELLMKKGLPPAAAAVATPVAGPVYSRERHGQCAIDPAAWSFRPSVSEAVWGAATARELKLIDAAALLMTLCRVEITRLREWSRPRTGSTASTTAVSTAPPLTAAHVRTAWKVSPQLAISIVQRFPNPVSSSSSAAAAATTPASDAQRALTELVLAAAADPRVQALPAAAMVLATEEAARARAPQLAALATWAPASAVQGLQLMCGPAQRHKGIKAYALRCLRAAAPAKVMFFLPQLVQALRHDGDCESSSETSKSRRGDEESHDGATGRYLLDTASRDDKFAHQLIWALATEEKPPPEEFNPEVKRSGWEPPKDTGLWEASARLKRCVLAGMTPEQRVYWEAEDGYFNKVTSISGILKKLEPDARRAKIKNELEQFGPTREDLYVPTNSDCVILGHIPESGAPMQSAAKVPILVKFRVAQLEPPPLLPLKKEVACIFKVGDDCRQDVLALQVITILRDAFQKAGLELYLRPYGCIPTGYGRGIIEVVPKSQSRAAMGELAERGLYEIFVSQFGPPNGDRFKAAQRNFITSEAGYAVASYLLQAKDRHNGNLLIDNEGHLVHIDFGFIMDISPGRNMGFESAAFKLSHEMTQLLDPGGKRNSESYVRFQEAIVRGYLVARTVAEPIIATVSLMSESGLPCFGYGKPLANLRKRFHLEMTEAQASSFMRNLINDSYDKWTTGVYDFIQNKQNRIPY